MSRSKRKSPVVKNTNSHTAQTDKRIANKKLRAAFRQAFHKDRECPVPPLLLEVSNNINFTYHHKWFYYPCGSDVYYDEVLGRDSAEELKKIMRK